MLIQRKPQGVLPHFLRGGKQNGGMIRAAEFLHDLFLRRGKVCVIEMFRLAVPVCRRLGAVRNCRAPQHHLIALLFRLPRQAGDLRTVIPQIQHHAEQTDL